MLQFDSPREIKAKEKELYKPIEKVQLSTLLSKHSFPSGNEYAIIDSDKNILNFCSEVYSPKLNYEIFPQVEQGLTAAGIEFRKKIKIIGNAKFYVDYIIMERMKTISVNDVFPKLSIWNSYDGVIKFRKEFGFYKLICSNGLCRPTEKHSSVSFKHTKNNNISIGNEIEKIAKDFIVDSKNDMKIFDRMNHKPATDKTVLQLAEETGLSLHVKQAALDRFKLETSGKLQYLNEHNETVISNGVPKTMFAVYNALNWAINNCNPKELPEKKIEKDRQVLELVTELA